MEPSETSDDDRPIGEAISALTTAIEGLRTDVANLRAELTGKPSRLEVARYVRHLLAVVLVVIFLVSQIGDLRSEHCSPGARIWEVIEHDPPLSGMLQIREFVSTQQPRWFCDGLYPFQNHTSRGWPAPWNIVGMVVYSAAGLIVGLWVWRAYHRPEPRTVPAE